MKDDNFLPSKSFLEGVMINYVELLKANPQYFKQFSCKELLFLNYDCPVKENKLAKWSEHNYFYYVLTGQKTLHKGNQSWPLTKGTLSFIKKGACLIEQFFREPFCIVVFVLPDSFISRFIASNKDQLPPERPQTKTDDLVIRVHTDEVLHKFYESVLPYFASQHTPSEKLIELKFTELLLHIVSNPQNTELISYLYSVAANKTSTLEHVMETNFAFHLQLNDYARLCNRSLSSFKRDFETIFKTTPGQWLLQKRLGYAHQLISDTDKPLADVILESGFENQAHFSKVFKARFGKSPLQFRKKIQETVS
jgi:AraC family transcriptional regulator, exoenzyme S synthesis regulatory protein ExsA